MHSSASRAELVSAVLCSSLRPSHAAGDTMSKEVPAGGEQAERAPEVKAAYGAAAMADLEEHIDWGSSECLNADSKHPFANAC